MNAKILCILSLTLMVIQCRTPDPVPAFVPIPDEYYGEYTIVSLEIDGQVDLNQDGVSHSNLFAESRRLYDNYKNCTFHLLRDNDMRALPRFKVEYPEQKKDPNNPPQYPNGYYCDYFGVVGESPKYDGKFHPWELYPEIKSMYSNGPDSFTVIKDIELVNYSDTSTYEMTLVYKKDL